MTAVENLGFENLDSEEVVKQLKPNTTLQKLSFYKNNFGRQRSKFLCEGISCCKSLKKLIIPSNNFSTVDTDCLLALFKTLSSTLRYINIGNANFNEESFIRILNVVFNLTAEKENQFKLKHLGIATNPMSENMINKLAHCLEVSNSI